MLARVNAREMKSVLLFATLAAFLKIVTKLVTALLGSGHTMYLWKTLTGEQIQAWGEGMLQPQIPLTLEVAYWLLYLVEIGVLVLAGYWVTRKLMSKGILQAVSVGLVSTFIPIILTLLSLAVPNTLMYPRYEQYSQEIKNTIARSEWRTLKGNALRLPEVLVVNGLIAGLGGGIYLLRTRSSKTAKGVSK